jgi:hypothetical protein
VSTQPVHRHEPDTSQVQHTIGGISDALRGSHPYRHRTLNDVRRRLHRRPPYPVPRAPPPRLTVQGDDDLRDLPSYDPAICRDQAITHGADSNPLRTAPTLRSAVWSRPWTYLTSISTTVHTNQTV